MKLVKNHMQMILQEQKPALRNEILFEPICCFKMFGLFHFCYLWLFFRVGYREKKP